MRFPQFAVLLMVAGSALQLYIDGIRAPTPPDTLGRTADDYFGVEFYTPGAAP